jgi:hypothetical protein
MRPALSVAVAAFRAVTRVGPVLWVMSFHAVADAHRSARQARVAYRPHQRWP